MEECCGDYATKAGENLFPQNYKLISLLNPIEIISHSSTNKVVPMRKKDIYCFR